MKIYKISASILLLILSLGSASAASELESAKILANQGIIKSGNTAADFGLNQTITRKEMMKVVMNLSGKSVTDSCSGKFGDVTNDWGCKYIETALSHGFIAANAKFRPNDSISKAESMKLILKAKGIEKAYNTTDWQADYMNTALDNGLISTTYNNHTTPALRGWIFSVAAKEKGSATSNGGGNNTNIENTGNNNTSEVVPGIEPETMTGYMDYDQPLVGMHDKTVIFFHAGWCPSCVAADKSISEAIPEIDNFLLLKADYDSELDLRKEYGVTSQHTFVRVDKNGDLVKKWSGGNTVASIKEKIGVE